MCSHRHFSSLLSFLCQLRASCHVCLCGIMEGRRTSKVLVCFANPAWSSWGNEDLGVNMDQQLPADGSALLKGEVKVLAGFAFSMGFFFFVQLCNLIGTFIPFAPEINFHFLWPFPCSLDSIPHSRAVLVYHSNKLLWGSLSNELLLRENEGSGDTCTVQANAFFLGRVNNFLFFFPGHNSTRRMEEMWKNKANAFRTEANK